MVSAMPARIQRKRTKGWRMPPGAKYVGRPGPFANPFVIGELVPPNTFWKNGSYFEVEDAAMAVCLFRHWLAGTAPDGFTTWRGGPLIINRRIGELRGHDLACWCPLIRNGKYVPCHADVLLELANPKS